MAGGRFGRAWAVFFGLGGASAWLGCNALAGIELGTLATTAVEGGTPGGGNDATMTTIGDAGGSPEDGSATPSPDSGGAGADSGGGDSAGGGGDAGAGMEAAAPKTYACGPSGATPFAVASLENADGGRAFDTRVALGVTQNQQLRIVVQVVGNPSTQGNQPNEVFRAYDVQWQPKMVDDSVAFMAPPGSHLANTISTSNGMTAIVTQGYFDNDAGSTSTVSAYFLAANQQNLNNAPPPYPLTTPVSGFNQSAQALELGLEDDFVVTFAGPLQSNRASADSGPTTPTTFAPAGPSQGGSDPTLVHGGSSVFAVYGGDPSSDASTLVYKLPDNGMNAQPVTPSLLAPGTLLAAAAPSTADPTKIVTYAATLVTSPTPVFSLFAGLVDGNHFDTLQLSALASGPSLTLHEVPAGKGTSTFVGDSLVLIGLSPVTSDQGLNFVWVDSNAHVLAEAVGPSRLYNSRPGIQAAAIVPVNNITGVLTTFFIAWVEEQNDTAGAYDLLYVDEVQCAAN
jgi:hypothetical protein